MRAVTYNIPLSDGGNVLKRVTIIGGGIAGSEAAWQLAARGVPVRLVEMRPTRMGPAHRTDALSELVCSNSFKSDDPVTAAGRLKVELEAFGSLILQVARARSVPAGAALAVDRDRFSSLVSSVLADHPRIEIVREEATTIPDGDAILAPGPLVSPALASAICELTGDELMAFYDAAAPIVEAASVDRSRVFPASRWGKGGGDDYLNCPLDRPSYERLVESLRTARRVEARDFERMDLFQACQPIEEIARKGPDALRYGALKPIGLTDPATGSRPWAVVQLRAENRSATAYNVVGFQTNLTFPEQRRILSAIPGLEDVVILRYGVMHRNTFIDAPRLLTPGFAFRDLPRVRVAGQLSGTEGYLEAAATGVLAALDVWTARAGLQPFVLPPESVLGALAAYATDPETVKYQPMHVNYGLVPPLETRTKGKLERYAAYSARAEGALKALLCRRPELMIPEVRQAALASIASADDRSPE